jgi:hypothetical protein
MNTKENPLNTIGWNGNTSNSNSVRAKAKPLSFKDQ